MLNLCESFWLKQHFKIDCNCSIELGFLMGQWKKDSKIVYLSVNGGERETESWKSEKGKRNDCNGKICITGKRNCEMISLPYFETENSR